jgi:hypothetical protein
LLLSGEVFSGVQEMPGHFKVLAGWERTARVARLGRT